MNCKKKKERELNACKIDALSDIKIHAIRSNVCNSLADWLKDHFIHKL